MYWVTQVQPPKTLGKPPTYVRVYTRSGKVAHHLRSGSVPNSSDNAWCGHSPWPYLWRGTGNEGERKTVESMRACKRCTELKDKNT